MSICEWLKNAKRGAGMLVRCALIEEFEKSQMRKETPDYARNLRIFEALFEEARLLGALPPKDRLEGIEVDIRVARAINV